MVGEAGAVVVFQHRVGGDHSLDDDIINFCPQFVHIITIFFQVFIDGADAPVKKQRLEKSQFYMCCYLFHSCIAFNDSLVKVVIQLKQKLKLYISGYLY